MAETTTITVRVPLALRDELDRLAKLTQRSRSFLAAEALELYARYELEIVEGILEGIADADAGRVFTTEQMREEMERVLAEVEARRAPKGKAAVNS